jgi:hypothetical protein
LGLYVYCRMLQVLDHAVLLKINSAGMRFSNLQVDNIITCIHLKVMHRASKILPRSEAGTMDAATSNKH